MASKRQWRWIKLECWPNCAPPLAMYESDTKIIYLQVIFRVHIELLLDFSVLYCLLHRSYVEQYCYTKIYWSVLVWCFQPTLDVLELKHGRGACTACSVPGWLALLLLRWWSLAWLQWQRARKWNGHSPCNVVGKKDRLLEWVKMNSENMEEAVWERVEVFRFLGTYFRKNV